MEAACCCSSPSPSLLTLHSLHPSSSACRLPVTAAASRFKVPSSSLVGFRRRSFTSVPLPPSLRYPSRRPPRRAISAVFERFTERAIKAVIFSQREARALGQDMVFNQHLLLGLVAEDRSPAGFLGSGITIDHAREAVRAISTEGGAGAADPTTPVTPSSVSATDVAFSISSKRVFEAAVDCSRNMGCNFIAPEHIAIGLFNADDGSVAQVLKRYNLVTASCLPFTSSFFYPSPFSF